MEFKIYVEGAEAGRLTLPSPSEPAEKKKKLSLFPYDTSLKLNDNISNKQFLFLNKLFRQLLYCGESDRLLYLPDLL